MKKPLVGFIGQGYIGKNYADDFEERGYTVIRYARRHPHAGNKKKIAECDVVFIAVPTPTTQEGFDDRTLRDVLRLVGKGKTAVIKSTVLPGTTESVQAENPDILVFHSPEFLTEANAAEDARHPNRNIIGIPRNTNVYHKRAKEVLAVLPKAPFELVCTSREAELIKYFGNVWFYYKVVVVNLMYDLAEALGTRYAVVRSGVSADPRIGESHLEPVHQSGRGAGGHCFIKDFSVFERLYKELTGDKLGHEMLKAVEAKNLELLRKSNKDLDLLERVYGKSRRR